MEDEKWLEERGWKREADAWRKETLTSATVDEAVKTEHLMFEVNGPVKHFKLVGETPVPCSLWEWATMFEQIEQRRVRLTTVGPFTVSTVFLGLDHNFYGVGPPILFETMTFAGDDSGSLHDEDGRDSCYADATARHQRVVDLLRATHCTPEELPQEIDDRAKPVPDPASVREALEGISRSEDTRGQGEDEG